MYSVKITLFSLLLTLAAPLLAAPSPIPSAPKLAATGYVLVDYQSGQVLAEVGSRPPGLGQEVPQWRSVGLPQCHVVLLDLLLDQCRAPTRSGRSDTPPLPGRYHAGVSA